MSHHIAWLEITWIHLKSLSPNSVHWQFTFRMCKTCPIPSPPCSNAKLQMISNRLTTTKETPSLLLQVTAEENRRLSRPASARGLPENVALLTRNFDKMLKSFEIHNQTMESESITPHKAEPRVRWHRTASNGQGFVVLNSQFKDSKWGANTPIWKNSCWSDPAAKCDLLRFIKGTLQACCWKTLFSASLRLD